MDSRIIDVMEGLMRKKFNLAGDFKVQTCNVKKNTIEMVMNDSLIEVKAKVPRGLVEDIIMSQEDDE